MVQSRLILYYNTNVYDIYYLVSLIGTVKHNVGSNLSNIFYSVYEPIQNGLANLTMAVYSDRAQVILK